MHYTKSLLLTLLLLTSSLLADSDQFMRERISNHPDLSEVIKEALLQCDNLIPDEHIALGTLESLFHTTPRPSTDHESLEKAGFEHITLRHRGTTFASHCDLTDFFFKLAVDKDEQSYSTLFGRHPTDVDVIKEFLGRIRLRNAIAQTIEEGGLESIKLPMKWLYLFPLEVQPLHDQGYSPKHSMLLAEKYELVGARDNIALWKEMSVEVLMDLFILVMKHSLYDVKPENCSFTVDGYFVIIDTKEFSSKEPRVSLPARFLGKGGKSDWSRLCKYGLPIRWRGYPMGWKG